MDVKVDIIKFRFDMQELLDSSQLEKLNVDSIFKEWATNDGGKKNNLIEVDSKELYEIMLNKLVQSYEKDEQISKSPNIMYEELKKEATRVLQDKYEKKIKNYEKLLKALNEVDPKAPEFGLE